MQKLAALFLVTVLAGCAFPGVYKINVQQGNILSEQALDNLDQGMTRAQVHALLGTPLVEPPLDDTKDYYIYTFQEAGGEIREQKVIVYYENDRFSRYEADLMEETPAY
jgi:outer membrane protein assembly factor BamE